VTASSHVTARHIQNSATEGRTGKSFVHKTINELRTASTRTATSIAATVTTERKTPWVKAAHYTLPGSEGLARLIYPGTWKVDSASFALGGPGSATRNSSENHPKIIGGPYNRAGRAKADEGEVRKNHAAPARTFIMRPHGALCVAPRVKLGLTLMNMNPPRLPGTPIGASENRNKNNKDYKNSSFGGCAVPALLRAFSSQ
jgi:hypothetical protein